MLLPRRRADLPHRQLVFWLFDDFVLRHGEVGSALDLGCGTLALAPLIKAKRYIAVDLDKRRLERGAAKRAPHAELHACAIEDIAPSVKADLVFCLQCIGTSRYFDPSATIACVTRMIEATNPGGALFFTIGFKSLSWQDDAEEKVRQAFERVQVFNYGRFRHAPRSKLLALGLAAMMRKYPKLARSGTLPRRIYMCEGLVGKSATERHDRVLLRE